MTHHAYFLPIDSGIKILVIDGGKYFAFFSLFLDNAFQNQSIRLRLPKNPEQLSICEKYKCTEALFRGTTSYT